LEATVIDGIYSMTYRGAADWGIGMLILRRSTITGSDATGVLYDGTYQDNGDNLDIRLTMTVPPGVTLAQGTPAQPTAYSVPINLSIPTRALSTGETVLMELPPGPVNIIFRMLRSLSD
jgi:hypothetical protein